MHGFVLLLAKVYIKHQSIFVVIATTSQGNSNCRSSAAPLFHSLVTSLIFVVSDALGLRVNVGFYITFGEYERMRDMMASSLVYWTEDMTMYPFVLG